MFWQENPIYGLFLFMNFRDKNNVLSVISENLFMNKILNLLFPYMYDIFYPAE